jgi:hypothetical protein
MNPTQGLILALYFLGAAALLLMGYVYKELRIRRRRNGQSDFPFLRNPPRGRPPDTEKEKEHHLASANR